MPRSTSSFLARLARRLAVTGRGIVRPRVQRASRTLAASLYTKVMVENGQYVGVVAIPHYWALYVHDGRKAFSKDKYMVWWRNPNEDPRLRGGKTPRRANQLRKLSRDQFLDAFDIYRQYLKAGNPYASPVVVTKHIRKDTPPDRFFDPSDGMKTFPAAAGRVASAEVSEHVTSTLREAGLLNVQGTISI